MLDATDILIILFFIGIIVLLWLVLDAIRVYLNKKRRKRRGY